MKLFDNIFSSIYLFFEAINNDRPGNKGQPIISAIFALTIIVSSNALSFLSAKELNRIPWLYYLVAIVSCSILIILFYRKKRYLKIASQFAGEKNKEVYQLLTIAYIVSSIAAFAITR